MKKNKQIRMDDDLFKKDEDLEFIDLEMEETENTKEKEEITSKVSEIAYQSHDTEDVFDTGSLELVDLEDLPETGKQITKKAEEVSGDKPNTKRSQIEELSLDEDDDLQIAELTDTGSFEFAEIEEKIQEKAAEEVLQKKVKETAPKKTVKKEKGVFFANLTRMDGVVWATGAIALVAIIILVTVGVRMRGSDKGDVQSVQTMEQLGQDLSEVEFIGQSGLLAVTDAQLAGQITPEEEITEVEPSQEDPEEVIQVKVSFTSVEKDLKIKFSNSETGKLVNNGRFEVKLTSASGTVLNYEDDDMDGIIYHNAMTPGKYSVEVAAPERFEIISCDSSVTVRDTIVYEKVEVENEIKAESEVNIATEDTQMNVKIEEEEEVTGSLQDTVEYVESTQTLVSEGNGYVEVEKGTIADPGLVAYTQSYAMLALDLAEAGEAIEDPEPTEEPTETPTPEPTAEPTETPTPSAKTIDSISLDKTSLTYQVGDNTKSINPKIIFSDGSEMTSGFANEGVTLTWTCADEKVAIAIPVDDKCVVNPMEYGHTTITVTAEDSYGNRVTATCEVTVNGHDLSISIDKSTATTYVGAKFKPIVTVTKNGTDKTSETEGVVTWTSSDEKIAKVDAKTGEITGVAKGTATITATTTDVDKDNKKLTVTCAVTVNETPSVDTTTKLTDKNGKQIYVQSGNDYVEATYADYYSAGKFYVKAEAQYKYTGWQTLNNRTYFYDKNGNAVTGEQIIQGVKYNFASDGSLVMGSGVFGIDVSKWNGTINWSAVKNAGVSFVIIRCGFRGSTQGALVQDAKFKENIEGAIAAGLNVGVYFYTQAVNEVEAVEEASMVLQLVKNYRISYPIFIDTEKSGGRADKISAATRTAICKAFCETIRNGGYTPGIYASKSWFLDNLNMSQLSGYKIWLAQYSKAPTYTGRYDLWQYSDKGTIPGISGSVDVNYSYLGY